MPPKKILVVEDDQDINELIRYNLTREGYEVASVFDGEQALDFAQKIKPDLILLDVMLPNVDGMDICRYIRADQELKHTPIIMITAKGEESDVLVGLQMGADDYITKPFSPKVLLARVKAILRRTNAAVEKEGKDKRIYGDLKIDLLKHKVYYKDEAISLTSIEFDIIEFLSRSPGRVYSREQILDSVWKEGKFIIDRAVDVHVRGLRKKLGKAEDYIQTVRGVGYCFKE